MEARARELGFDLVGFARAGRLDTELDEFLAWLGEGRHGTMEWLARDPERRADPTLVLPGCRSVVVVAMNYLHPEEQEQRDASPAGKVSRYARGRDYHRVFEKALRKIARFLDAEGPEGTRSKPYVDYGPAMERVWAVRAGLGFAGKHTLLIHPEHGSWFFLGVILTTAEFAPSPPLAVAGGCGDCRRCIDACPTGAITEPWRFDARRCISYLTIEHDGAIEEELAEKMDGWVFGCDACQDVCPYNRKRAEVPDADRFAPRMAPAEWSLAEMMELTEEEVARRFTGSPLKRAGAEKLKRNARIAAKSSGKK
ncbi:MAG: epoxyqueuosine reductase [Candidatus Sumerlaeota bacterium]|nr:epoxyqueuosine reductase [Candidatus Sumerlaeota bacterium]